MELKQREELSEKEKVDYALAYCRSTQRHLRELTIAYNIQETENIIKYSGAVNPFIGEFSPIELAMACGYWKYMCGGSVVMDRSGGFEVIINKGKELEYFI